MDGFGSLVASAAYNSRRKCWTLAKKMSVRGRIRSIAAGMEICPAPGAATACTISRGCRLNWNNKVSTLINTAARMPFKAPVAITASAAMIASTPSRLRR
jgi:hypothetical protein